jgi:transcription elongation factor GreA
MTKYITLEGLEKLKKEVEYLRTTKREELADRLQKAIAQGDLSENFDYSDAKEEQAMLQGKIAQLEEQIRESQVVTKTTQSDKVQIGSQVEAETQGEILIFTIVTAQEADPLQGKISVESPTGEALLNKKKGEKAVVSTPGGSVEYKILTIS